MSGDTSAIASLAPVVTALQSAITSSDIVTLFAQAVVVALPLILTWFGCRWVYGKFKAAVKGGRG